MNISDAQIKTLAILFVFVCSVAVFEHKDVLVANLSGEQQSASAFSTLTNFLGISTSNDNSSNSSNENTNTNNNEISGSGNTQTTLNTPAASNSNTSTNTQTTATGPLASRGVTLVCVPPIIGVTEKAIIMWACRDGAHTTEGENFDTKGATAGSVRVTPNEDTTYTIECINDLDDTDNTASSCLIKMADPNITFTANSNSVERGKTIDLTWNATDVNSCLLASDTHTGFTRQGVTGDVTTPPILRNTKFILTCESASGLLEKKELEVNLR